MRVVFNTGSISPRKKRAQGVIKEQLRSRFEHPALRVVVFEFQNCCIKYVLTLEKQVFVEPAAAR